jgi:hypothetical protein|tara:strand:- start:3961 stop:4458 length:498 start_codon:yes stop_codon:yes gene_type:complete
MKYIRINSYMKTTKAVILSLLVLTSCCITTYAQGTTPDMVMPKTSIRGIVLLQDGETPVHNLRVRVWNIETEEIVFKEVTNDNGIFAIPEFKDSDNYYVTIGPVKVDLSLLTTRGVKPQENGFVIILPKKMPLVQTIQPVKGVVIGSASTVGTKVLADKPKTVSP